MTKTKLAATILLGRDRNGILEVLLLKRNKALAFAGGLWVFPGGKIEPSELVQSQTELEAAKLAAVRETQEEANITIATDTLLFFSHWTTPIAEPRRYATYFFFSAANEITTPVAVDDSEIKDYVWLSPQTALDRFRAGQLAMMPPTLMSLQLIRKCQSVAEIQTQLSKEPPIFTLPVLQAIAGKMICMYEGDAGYATGNASLEGARHRLNLHFSKNDFIFEFSDCATHIKPLNGNMHLV